MVVGFAVFARTVGVLIIGWLFLSKLIDGFRLHIGEVEVGFLVRLVNKEVELGFLLEGLVGGCRC